MSRRALQVRFGGRKAQGRQAGDGFGDVASLTHSSDGLGVLQVEQRSDVGRRKLFFEVGDVPGLLDQLAAADVGSLFDLKKDNAEAIGQVIATNVSESKARNIAKAINEKLRVKTKPTR